MNPEVAEKKRKGVKVFFVVFFVLGACGTSNIITTRYKKSES